MPLSVLLSHNFCSRKSLHWFHSLLPNLFDFSFISSSPFPSISLPQLDLNISLQPFLPQFILRKLRLQTGLSLFPRYAMLSPALQPARTLLPFSSALQPLQKSQPVTSSKLLGRAEELHFYSPTSSNSIFPALLSSSSVRSKIPAPDHGPASSSSLRIYIMLSFQTFYYSSFRLDFILVWLMLHLRRNDSLAISFTPFLQKHPSGVQQVDKSSA